MINYIAMPLVRRGNHTEFVTETRTLPPPETDEVTLRIRACGVCGSDVARWRGEAYQYPLVIGHEFSGEVVYDPQGLLTGKRVVAFPLIPCGSCTQCAQERYAMCEAYDYYGSRRDGAFAAYLNIKRKNLLEIPQNVSFAAAAMCEPTAVALNAIQKSPDLFGKTVAIYGAGTIGLLLIKLAKIFGAKRIFVSEPEAGKRAFAESCGAEILPEQDLADVYFDACGRSEVLLDMLKRAKSLSYLILLGNPSGNLAVPKDLYWRILRGELTLKGTWNSRFSYKGSRNDWECVLGLMRDGTLTVEELITHRFPITQAEEALRTMTDQKCFSIKVMLTNEGES